MDLKESQYFPSGEVIISSSTKEGLNSSDSFCWWQRNLEWGEASRASVPSDLPTCCHLNIQDPNFITVSVLISTVRDLELNWCCNPATRRTSNPAHLQVWFSGISDSTATRNRISFRWITETFQFLAWTLGRECIALSSLFSFSNFPMALESNPQSLHSLLSLHCLVATSTW